MARPPSPDLIPATLRGGSMRPWLAPGTDVLVRPADGPRDCRAGDVLVFRLGDAWAAHRALRGVNASSALRPRSGGGSSCGSGLPIAAAGAGRPLSPPVPPTRGDWTGRADPAADPGALLGRVAYARIGGRWWRVEGAAARLAGLATGAVVALLTRLGVRGLLSEIRGPAPRARRHTVER